MTDETINLADLLINKEYQHVNQLLTCSTRQERKQEISYQQVNQIGTKECLYPIEVVYEILNPQNNHSKEMLQTLFSIFRQLIEHGAIIHDPHIYVHMFGITKNQDQQLYCLLRASYYSKEELIEELNLCSSNFEKSNIEKILLLQSELEKKHNAFLKKIKD